jgi:hypothetical protein
MGQKILRFRALIVIALVSLTFILTSMASPVLAEVTPLPANDGNITDIEPDQINISNLDQPLLPGITDNGTGAPTDNPYVMTPASASPTVTPAPTKSPSGALTILGTVAALAMVVLLARKKK